MSNDSDDPHGFKRPQSIKGEVGYKKPPKKTRWKPGQSGNRNGRPKKSEKEEDIYQLISSTLDQEIVVQENGKKKKVTKREAIVFQAVNKALSGDKKFIDYVWSADERRLQERQKRDAPQCGVLVVGPIGVPTEAGLAKGYKTIEEEIYHQQAKYRNSEISPKDEDKK